MSVKLAWLIGIPVVGPHQGQRIFAPHQQAGHMTAADQIVQSAKKVLARERRPHKPFRHVTEFRTLAGGGYNQLTWIVLFPTALLAGTIGATVGFGNAVILTASKLSFIIQSATECIIATQGARFLPGW
jgi:phosphate/sulfate permease